MADAIEVTPATVRSDFKTLQEFSDEHVEEAITGARVQVIVDEIQAPDDVKTRAVILFARHLLFSDRVMSYGGVLSASTFGNSQTLKDFGGNDLFLHDYDTIVAKYGVDEDMGAVWTE